MVKVSGPLSEKVEQMNMNTVRTEDGGAIVPEELVYGAGLC